MSDLHLHFSPLQQRSGLLVFQKRGSDDIIRTLNLLVLPKLWYRPRRDPWPTFTGTIQSLNIVVYEGERHSLKNVPDCWMELFTQCAEMIESKSPAQDEEDNLNADLDEDTLQSLNGLFTILSNKPKQSLLTNQDHPDEPPNFADAFSQLFRLSILCDKFKERELRLTRSSLVNGVSLSEGDNPDCVYQLLAVQHFISEMEAHLHQIHQDYVPTVETLDSIRGSVTGHSLMLLDGGVTLHPECRYNKFVSDTPLYQVLVSTLDAILLGMCWPDDPLLHTAPLIDTLRLRAQQIRQHMRHITSVPIQNAQYLCDRVHLNILQEHWQPALDLARILLKQQNIDLRDSAAGSGGYMWVIDTAAVWESILAQGFQLETALELKNTTPDTLLHRPWISGRSGLGNRPDMDILLTDTQTSQTFIVDAKYKVKRDNFQNPIPKESSKTEQYQIFTYSHLVSVRSPNERIHSALIYPVQSNVDMQKINKDHVKRYNRFSHTPDTGSTCTLTLCYVPFPSTNDVMKEDVWKTYTQTLHDHLSNQLISPSE